MHRVDERVHYRHAGPGESVVHVLGKEKLALGFDARCNNNRIPNRESMPHCKIDRAVKNRIERAHYCMALPPGPGKKRGFLPRESGFSRAHPIELGKHLNRKHDIVRRNFCQEIKNEVLLMRVVYADCIDKDVCIESDSHSPSSKSSS